MLIDTHKAVGKMIAVGLNQKQAEAIIEVISNIDTKIATKSDIVRLETKIDSLKWMLICALVVMMLGLMLILKF